MLKHHANAEFACRLRVGDAHGLAVPNDLALIRLHDAIDHFDEGGFACAIFAEQCVNLACRHLNADVIIRQNTRELF